MYPTNEKETIELYKSLQDEFGWRIVHLQGPFPDAIIENAQGKSLVVEFEYEARNFKKHKHDKRGCDLIICWRNNWIDAPLPVWALDQASAKTASVERFKQAYLELAARFDKRIQPLQKSPNDTYYMDKVIDLEDEVAQLKRILEFARTVKAEIPTIWDWLGFGKQRLRRKREKRAFKKAELCPFCFVAMNTRCEYWREQECTHGGKYSWGDAIQICPQCGFRQVEQIHYKGCCYE